MALRVSKLKPNSWKMKNIGKKKKKKFKKTERDRDKNRKKIEKKSRYTRKTEDSEKVTKDNFLSYQNGFKWNFVKKKKRKKIKKKKKK